jgi:hypothetical protein
MLRSAQRVRYSIRYLLNGYPAVYLPLARLRQGSREERVVGRGTELVIEGFGRSGNTFAVEAFQLAQARPVRIAHHTHAPATVIRAIRLGVPTMVVVRDPVDAAVSHLFYRDLAAGDALRAWIRYHRRLLPHRPAFVVAPFSTVTTDFGSVIREVNERFGTTFEAFVHSQENVGRVFELIERRNRARHGTVVGTISRPSADREAHKAAVRRLVEAPRWGELRRQAEDVYRALVPS